MRMITVSRQFGSGGRELGRRLADLLGWDYYDREIIQAVAAEQGLNPEAVHRMLSHHGWQHYQLTYRNSFRQPVSGAWRSTELLSRQREVILDIAQEGNDCVIVGRDADVILREYHPFRIFVCADMDARLARCMRYEAKKPDAERLSEKEILRGIRRIDRARRQTREILTGTAAAEASTFDLTVNSATWEIHALTEAAADFARRWFDQRSTPDESRENRG